MPPTLLADTNIIGIVFTFWEEPFGEHPGIVFSNSKRIDIPHVGKSTAFPSIIRVRGLTNQVGSVSVTISGLTHGYSGDLDILLVGPQGQNCLLLSDAGRGSVSNLTLTFSSYASHHASLLRLRSGFYLPTDFNHAPDTFSNQASFNSNLEVFKRSDPNGDWQLYINDDFSGSSGLVAGGWTLEIGTTNYAGDNFEVTAQIPEGHLVHNYILETSEDLKRWVVLRSLTNFTNKVTTTNMTQYYRLKPAFIGAPPASLSIKLLPQ